MASQCYYDAVACRYDASVDLHRYTGKERDTESGLDYFGARYMASSMGRFTSPDPTFAHNITAFRGNHLPPPGSIAEIRQAVVAALNAGQYSTKANGVIEGNVTIQGVQCGFNGAKVNGVIRISTVFANR